MRVLAANITKDFCGKHATDRPVVEGGVTPLILNLLRLLEDSVQKRQFVSMQDQHRGRTDEHDDR